MKPAKPIRYTIRSVPVEVDRALRDRAKREGKSLNEIALEALARAVGASNCEVIHHDLDHLIGTWIEDPKFDEAMAAQRQTNPEMWQ